MVRRASAPSRGEPSDKVPASAETGFFRDEIFLIGFHSGRRHVAPALQPVHLVRAKAILVAGLGFLAAFFPAAIAPPTIHMSISSAIIKKPCSFTVHFSLICFLLLRAVSIYFWPLTRLKQRSGPVVCAFIVIAAGASWWRRAKSRPWEAQPRHGRRICRPSTPLLRQRQGIPTATTA